MRLNSKRAYPWIDGRHQAGLAGLGWRLVLVFLAAFPEALQRARQDAEILEKPLFLPNPDPADGRDFHDLGRPLHQYFSRLGPDAILATAL